MSPPARSKDSESGGSGGKRLAREGLSYLVVGLIQLVLDWGCFVGLSALGMPVAGANIIGRIAGATLGFQLNGAYTFAEAGVPKTGGAHLWRFVAAWVLNALLSTLGVVLIERTHGLGWAWASKPVLDVALAGVGFVLSKYWIYR